jgi:hypothetical protein
MPDQVATLIFGLSRYGARMLIFGAFAVVLAWTNAIVTSCACGHMSLVSLPGALAAAGLAWFSLVRNADRSLFLRVLLIGAVALTSVLLAKVGADLLWFGHDSLLVW